MSYKDVPFAFCVGMALTVLLMVLSPLWMPLFFIGFGIMILTLLMVGIFWRCPSCGHRLPTNGLFTTTYCPGCGEKLF